MNISNQHYLYSDVANMLDQKPKILSYREQEKIKDAWLKDKLDNILPKILKRCDIDMWLVICNEYNEDPVLSALVPCAMMSARRLTILVFYLQDDGTLKKMAITRPGVGLDDYYESMWKNPKGYDWALQEALMPNGSKREKGSDKPETQWECLNRIINDLNPKKIGINISNDFAFADGLSHSLYNSLISNLDKANIDKLTSAEKVCVGYLEARTDKQIIAYNSIMQIAHAMIDEAFSNKVIIPGVTTNSDVKYHMLQRTINLGLEPWFDYEVSITRNGVGKITQEAIIMPGDLLHCDVGFRYLGLCTDTQENCYILKIDEQKAPEYLNEALRQANTLQDITISFFKEGRSGNEVLSLAREEAIKQGLKPCIYSHPIGNHGHGAGPTIGLWDMQNGVKGRGDYPIYNNTAYSLELCVDVDIKEWNMTLSLGAETDIIFIDNKVYYLGGRQKELHLVK